MSTPAQPLAGGAAAPLPPDLGVLRTRYQAVRMRYSALQGRATELMAQKSRLSKAISLAKARIELDPLANETFKYLQEQAHRNQVGDFEDLLSAFVGDVVPQAGRVHLELYTERNAPALDIMLDYGGDLENVAKRNGGGLTNVLVTGLEFTALARTANRQLLVLDEPDCWLAATYVPNFTKVIAETANPRELDDGSLHPGCQTLMISHNDVALMDSGAHLQELRIQHDLEAFAARWGAEVVRVGDVCPFAHVVWVPGSKGSKPRIEVRYRSDRTGDDEKNALNKGFPFIEPVRGARPWSDDLPGVRWIEVENLCSHVKTRLELSPGLNVLAGDINGGKSNLYISALRAIAYGESEDDLIRHGADTMVVRLGLEDDVMLEMVRRREGSPKVIYRVFQGGTKLHEGAQGARNTVPEFIREVLRVERVDGLDIQLRSQKEPVFLLNEPASVRARLLSVGKESSLLQDLIERHRKQMMRDRAALKTDEAELARVNRQLKAMAPLSGMTTLVEVLNGMLDGLQDGQNRAKDLRALLGRLKPLESRSRLLALVREDLGREVRVPSLKPTEQLSALVAQIKATQGPTRLLELAGKELARQITVPVLKPTAELESLVTRLAAGRAQSRLLELVGADLAREVAIPALKPTQPLVALLERLRATGDLARLPLPPEVPTLPVLKDTQGLRTLLAALRLGAPAAALLERLPPAPAIAQLQATDALRQRIALLTKLRKDGTELAATERKLRQEEAQAEAALHQLQHDLGVCPTCAKPFDNYKEEGAQAPQESAHV